VRLVECSSPKEDCLEASPVRDPNAEEPPQRCGTTAIVDDCSLFIRTH
jgi:hypothetical protein